MNPREEGAVAGNTNPLREELAREIHECMVITAYRGETLYGSVIADALLASESLSITRREPAATCSPDSPFGCVVSWRDFPAQRWPHVCNLGSPHTGGHRCHCGAISEPHQVASQESQNTEAATPLDRLAAFNAWMENADLNDPESWHRCFIAGWQAARTQTEPEATP